MLQCLFRLSKLVWFFFLTLVWKLPFHVHVFILVEKLHISARGKENQPQDHTWNTCVFALLSPEVTSALRCWSLLICHNIWELLVLFHEAALPVSPWKGNAIIASLQAGRCSTQGHGAEKNKDLKSPFKWGGLNLCLRYTPVLSVPPTLLCPFPQPSTTGSAPSCSPSHFPLGLTPLNHLNHLGLLRELNGRRHILSATTPDTPACQTLSLLEGKQEVGWKRKPLKLQKWISEVSQRWFSMCSGLFTDLNKGFLGMWWIFSTTFSPDSLWQLEKFFQCKGTS